MTARRSGCNQAATTRAIPHSLVRRWNSLVATTLHTPRMTSDQMSAAATGCCIGHSWIVDDGFGLPQSSRTAAATALTGFQAAILPSHAGRWFVGTNAFDTNASGNRMMSPIDCADSGPFTARPMHAPNQLSE